MSENYTPPTISNELGRPAADAAADRNFYARGSHKRVIADIDGVSVTEMLEKFGSPLFVFSEHTIREKARKMRNAFLSRYKKTQFAWSYKTNYLKAICQIMHQEGWMAEVVSDFEYEKANQLGKTGEDIIYNGPFKPIPALKKALEDGALVQVDNWDELTHIETLAKELDKPANVGIRIWLDAGIKPVWSRFGFALENGEAERAAVRIVKNPKLRLHTLHTHIGTFILAPEAYATAARKLLALREQIEADHGHLVDCINLGGGFPSYSLLYGMSGPPEQVIPPIERYATVIADVFNRLPDDKKPILRLESGRYLVDEAGYLLTTVVAVKGASRPVAGQGELNAIAQKERLLLGEEAKVGYVVDAGVNLLYTAAWFQINADPARDIDPPPVPSRLYGSLCMAIDVIRNHIDLPPLDAGDVLVLHPVGAYNTSQSMQFINYRPAVVLVGEKGEAEIIRKREHLDDIDHLETMPDRLAHNGAEKG